MDIRKYQEAFANLPAGAAWAEVNVDGKEEYAVRFHNGRQSGCELYEKTAVYLQASDGANTGVVYTENTDESPLSLIEEALKCARYSGRKSHTPLGAGASFNRLDSREPEDILSYGQDLCALVENNPAVKNLRCTVRRTSQSRQVCNSLGLCSEHSVTYYLVSLDIELEGDASASLVRSASSLQALPAEKLLADAVQKAKLYHDGKGLGKISLPSGPYHCVLSADVICNILMTAWQEFTAANLASGVSAFHRDFSSGQAIGSAALTIVDAPSHPEWGYDLALDSQGNVSRRKAVVKNGLLAEPLRTLYDSPSPDGALGGNAGRAALLSGTIQVNTATIPTIFYIEPGQASVADLLSSMGTGLFITRSMDEFHSSNISAGSFSIPCGGVVYKNGKPVGAAEQITMTGSLRDLFLSVQAAGNDLQFDEFTYHNYCFGGPSLLISDIMISSGN